MCRLFSSQVYTSDPVSYNRYCMLDKRPLIATKRLINPDAMTSVRPCGNKKPHGQKLITKTIPQMSKFSWFCQRLKERRICTCYLYLRLQDFFFYLLGILSNDSMLCFLRREVNLDFVWKSHLNVSIHLIPSAKWGKTIVSVFKLKTLRVWVNIFGLLNHNNRTGTALIIFWRA